MPDDKAASLAARIFEGAGQISQAKNPSSQPGTLPLESHFFETF